MIVICTFVGPALVWHSLQDTRSAAVQRRSEFPYLGVHCRKHCSLESGVGRMSEKKRGGRASRMLRVLKLYRIYTLRMLRVHGTEVIQNIHPQDASRTQY